MLSHRLQGGRVECLTEMFLRHPFVTMQVFVKPWVGYGMFYKAIVTQVVLKLLITILSRMYLCSSCY